MTEIDVKILWERDHAEKLRKASLDRIDSNKNYTRENCRFIEFYENIRLAHGGCLEEIPF